MPIDPSLPPGNDPRKDKIEVVDHDPGWPGLFTQEKAALEKVLDFASGLAIEHFGSTSVPGLAAKPIIDIMVGVSSRDIWPRLIEPLQGLDYIFWDKNPRKEEMFFVKGMPPFGERRTHHLHVYDLEGSRWRKELLFRDALRSRPEEAVRYAELKRVLAAQFTYDRDAYTDSKTDFIEGLLRKIGHQ